MYDLASRKKRPILLMGILIAAVLLALMTAMMMATQSQQISKNPAEVLSQVNGRLVPNERPPRDDFVVARAAGIPKTASIEEFELAASSWYDDFYQKKEKGGPNPLAYDVRMAALDAAESDGMSPMAASASLSGTAKMLMIPFDFDGTDMIPGCDITGTQTFTATVTGPLKGGIPDPALEGDNNTIYAPNGDFTIEWYEELMFGNGITTPVRTDLNGGAGVDLTGVSATNWYLEQSEGVYDLEGDIYPSWIQLDHSVAYYGWDGDEVDPEGRGYPCDGNPSGYGFEFVIDIAAELNAQNPGFDWSQYDVSGPGDEGPPDGIVDHLMVIHAGVDNSAGGGTYGNYQLWAHSWDVYCDKNDGNGLTLGCQVQGEDTPETSDDIYISNYTHIPEDADIGVVVHEYGHDIGLPDYYDQTGATSNSTAHWIVMSGGSWSGELGGSHPTPFNPWARYFFGWEDPTRVPYTDTVQIDIGQSEPTPLGTEDSVWIDLPDQAIEVENMAGTGKGLHSILGNDLESPLQKEFNLSSATNPVLTFDTYFTIEEDWDYTYVRASTDGGSNWTILLNEEGVYATSDPNGTLPYLGPGGLTGHYEGVLTYDLSAYAGQSAVLFEFLYATDTAVQDPGIWIDNISLDDGATNLYAQDFEGDYSDWDDVDSGWEEVPYNETFEQYYMLEWRNDEGSIAQEGHRYNYYSLAHDQDGWLVDKFPSNVPGLLVWYRNNFYNNNQAINGGRDGASPADGPKGELLLVDSHYEPIPWSGGWLNAGHFSNRRSAMDGTLSLDNVPVWNIHDEADSANAVMDFGSRGAVTAFHDSMRSVPGWLFEPGVLLDYADQDASVVIPASDDYTTRIRGFDANGNPGDDLYGFWGFTVTGNNLLGSGHPGDSGVQYGVHVALTDVAVDGSQATVNIWNSDTFVDVDTDINEPFPGGTAEYTAVVTNTSPLTETFDFEFYVEYADGTDETYTETVTLDPGDTYNKDLSDSVALGTAIGTILYAEAQVSIPSQNFEDISASVSAVTSPLSESSLGGVISGSGNAGDLITYTVSITNSDSRVIDGFVYVPIPENTSYVNGSAFGGLTPISMSAAAFEALISSGDVSSLNQVAAVDEITALIAPANIPANGTLPDMGFTISINAGVLSGSVDVSIQIFESGYDNPIGELSSSIDIEPAYSIFLPIVSKE